MLKTICSLTTVWMVVALSTSAPVKDEQGKVKIIYHVGDIVEHAYTNDAWHLQQSPPVNRLQNANAPEQRSANVQTNSNSKVTDTNSNTAHTNTNSANSNSNLAHPNTNSPGQNLLPNTNSQSLAHPNTNSQSLAHPNTNAQSLAHPNTNSQSLAHPNTNAQSLAHPNTNSPNQNQAHPITNSQTLAHPNTNSPGPNLAHPETNSPNSNSNPAHPKTNFPNSNSNSAHPNTNPMSYFPSFNTNSNSNSPNLSNNSPKIEPPNTNSNSEISNSPRSSNTNTPFGQNILANPLNTNVNLFPGHLAINSSPQHPSQFQNANPSQEDRNKPSSNANPAAPNSFVPNTFHNRGDNSATGIGTGFPPFFHNSNNNLNHHNTHFNVQPHRGAPETSETSTNQKQHSGAASLPHSPSSSTTTTTTTTSTTTTTTTSKPSSTTTSVPTAGQQVALHHEVPLQRHVPQQAQQPPFSPETAQKSLDSFLAMLEETKAPGGAVVDDQRPSASVAMPSTAVQQLPTPEALIQQSSGAAGQQTAPKDWAVYDDHQANQTAVLTQDHKYGYIVHGNNFKRFRVEEKTGNGVVHGLFGVHHNNGNFRGVQYQADSGEVHPKIIYDTLVKFLSL